MTLVEYWNGSGWAIQSTPSLAPFSNSFSGVSCTAPTAVTLAERWNGTSWAIQTTPNPSGATASHLNNVSCTAATACTAAGDYTNGSGTEVTLSERWNGSTWAVRATPNPSGAVASSLSGVSCTAATACSAAGFYINGSGTELTLAESWNGTSWAIQPTPNPAGATSSALSGLSCTAAAACTAVGDYRNVAGTNVTLAEAWNGTSWGVQSTPNPSSSTGSFLYGVSCTAAASCTAAGVFFLTRAGAPRTLAERFS
jgi:hypothetical protein